MTQHILFDAAGIRLAVPAQLVRAVHEHLPVQAIEGTRNWFLGLAIVSGRLLPVTDLGAFCGKRLCTGRTMELDPDTAIAALRVDAVTGLSDEQPVPVEMDSKNTAIGGGSLTLTGESLSRDNHDHWVLDVQALVKSAAFVDIKGI